MILMLAYWMMTLVHTSFPLVPSTNSRVLYTWSSTIIGVTTHLANAANTITMKLMSKSPFDNADLLNCNTCFFKSRRIISCKCQILFICTLHYVKNQIPNRRTTVMKLWMRRNKNNIWNMYLYHKNLENASFYLWNIQNPNSQSDLELVFLIVITYPMTAPEIALTELDRNWENS